MLWHFRIFPNVFDGLSMLTNVLLVLARSVPLNKVRKRFIAVFVHPQVPGVRERVDSDSICHVFVCSVSWFLRAFNARAHASIYIYIYIYIMGHLREIMIYLRSFKCMLII